MARLKQNLVVTGGYIRSITVSPKGKIDISCFGFQIDKAACRYVRRNMVNLNEKKKQKKLAKKRPYDVSADLQKVL